MQRNRIYTVILLGLSFLLNAPAYAIQSAFTATQHPDNPFVFSLDAGDSDPGAGAYITQYEWSSAGVSIANGRTTVVDFSGLGSSRYGSHDIVLTVTNSATPAATSNATNTVLIAGDHPVASFSYTVNNSEVRLNAGPSYSALSSISTYQWDVVPAAGVFSQDPANPGTSPLATIVFSQAGSYSVNLTVTDAAGQQASLAQTVIVDAVAPPVAQMSSLPSLTNIRAPATVTFDGSTSISGVGVHYYLWSIKNDQGEVSFFANSTAKTPQYTFTQPGRYEVTLEVIDNKGRLASITRPATVIDPAHPVLGTSLIKIPANAPALLPANLAGNFGGGVLYQNGQQGAFLAANGVLPAQTVNIVASLLSVDPSHQGQPVDLLAVLVAPDGRLYTKTSSQLVPFVPLNYTGNASVLAAEYGVTLSKSLRFEIASGTLNRLAAGTYKVWPGYRLRQAVGADAAGTIFLSETLIQFRK